VSVVPTPLAPSVIKELKTAAGFVVGIAEIKLTQQLTRFGIAGEIGSQGKDTKGVVLARCNTPA